MEFHSLSVPASNGERARTSPRRCEREEIRSVQSAFGTNPPLRTDAPSAGPQPLDPATRATIVALGRALELHDPALARSAAAAPRP